MQFAMTSGTTASKSENALLLFNSPLEHFQLKRMGLDWVIANAPRTIILSNTPSPGTVGPTATRINIPKHTLIGRAATDRVDMHLFGFPATILQ